MIPPIEERTEISERSKISIGLAITLGVIFLSALGALGGAIWWAASMHEKVSQLVTLGQAHAAADKTQTEDITAIRERVHMLEKYGSESVALRVTDLERRQSDMERKFIK